MCPVSVEWTMLLFLPIKNFLGTIVKKSCSGVFIVNFEHISHFVLLFILLTLNM